MLKNGKIRRDISHLIGTKINRLTIIEDLGRIENARKVKALCECGKLVQISVYSILNNNTKSCGCFNREKMTKHGFNGHPLHFLWKNVLSRCASFKKKNDYGSIGVRVCDEWKNDFMAFYNWAIDKWRPGLELDKDKLSKIKPGKLYSPEFCCFITQKENLRNKGNNIILSHDGKTMCLSAWSELTKINYGTLNARITRLGWDIEMALTVRPKTNYIR